MTVPGQILEDIRRRLGRKESVRFRVKISAGGGRSAVTGSLGENTLKIRISAAPEKGKANKELIELLSKTFDVSRSSVTIATGHTSPMKTIEIIPK
jgi:uncharacterized protein (TIGR00251 family)